MEKRGRGRQPWLLHYYRKKWVLIMRYQIRHARVQFGGDVILRDVNFEVHDREKIDDQQEDQVRGNEEVYF